MTPAELVGLSIEDVRVRAFLTSLIGTVEVRTFEGRTYYKAKSAGIAMATDGDPLINTVFLYSEGLEDYCAFHGVILEDVTMASSRHDVHRALSHPDEARTPHAIPFFGMSAPSDRYDRPAYVAHFEYFDDDRIRLATLMQPNAAP